MELSIIVNNSDDPYSYFIDNYLKNIKISKNHTCNTENELKYIFLKTIIDSLNKSNEDNDSIIYSVLCNNKFDQETFDIFMKSIPANHFAIYNDVFQKVETYLNYDHFVQSDYDLGTVIRMNTEDGIKDFINDDIELIEIEHRIIPFTLCQKYGYIHYDSYQCELNPQGTELFNTFFKYNEIKYEYYFDEQDYGMIKKLKDSYFILNEQKKWSKITIIPNSYGRKLGFSYYERIINENNWDIEILISPFEALNLKNLSLRNIFI